MDFFVFLPAVTFTFDLLTPKSNQHIDEPKYIGNPNLEKDHFIRFWDMVFQKFSGCTDSLTHRRKDPTTECLWYCFSMVA